MTFPYDFGFVPSTEADDGDPVDVLVLMSASRSAFFFFFF
jgi:inorganic pyrophosphatase